MDQGTIFNLGEFGFISYSLPLDMSDSLNRKVRDTIDSNKSYSWTYFDGDDGLAYRAWVGSILEGIS
jgi:hypothetical protein